MPWQAWVTLLLVAAMAFALVREIVQPAVTVLAADVLLLLCGIIDPRQAFAGFSNEAPIIVAAMLIFGRAVDISGGLQPTMGALFGSAKRIRLVLARLLPPIAGVSGFVNNTALVAMAVPVVLDLAPRRRLDPSRMLIPVSFAAVLGGVITAVGTSTNLTVSGLLVQAGMPPLGLFELTPVGLPIALAGVTAVILLAPVLLPTRNSPRAPSGSGGREFTVTMRVDENGPIDGMRVDKAGLRHLQGVFLVEVERRGHSLAPVAPGLSLAGGDLLTFVGRVNHVVDLQRMPGLHWAEAKHIEALEGGGHAFHEAVVGPELGGAGHTLRSVGFRARFGAAVLAIYRADHRLDAKLGDVPLRLGDTLLVLADRDFNLRWRDARDFLLIAPMHGPSPQRPQKAWIVGVLGLAFIILTGTSLVPILQASLGLALLLVATRAISVRQARDALDLNILVLIAAAFGIGAAVASSGLALTVADLIVGAFGAFGPVGALAGLIVTTMLLTELMSNSAAAVLLFPVGLAIAAATGSDPRPFVIAVTVAASLSFLTPIGYQTNLMVYALGGYRFTDFTRLGLPISALCVALELILIPVVFPF